MTLQDAVKEDDAVVIGGIAGRFPETMDVRDFYFKLLSGLDLVNDEESRWPHDSYDMPKRAGKMKNCERFDADFFGITAKQAENMDVRHRLLLELTFEAMYDAGLNPSALRGSNTGVFVGASGMDSFSAAVSNAISPEGYALPGHHNAILSNRISFAFDLHGPSMTIDTACSSGLICLQRALLSIRAGECDCAIVASANTFTEPKLTQVISNFGMLSKDGACKTFDEDGVGYVRSEAAVCFIVCKSKMSKRVYASIVHAKSNADGAKDGGLNQPSPKAQEQLLRDTYREANVSPAAVTYLEAHGTGTVAGDAVELTAIEKVFCEGRPSDTPLLVGSVKSNIGHTEGAAGLAAIVKLIMSHCHGTLPGNLHFKTPNSTLRAMLSRGSPLKVVDQNIPWPGHLMGVSSFGFGGANTHVILQFHKPSWTLEPTSALPPIVPLIARTKDMLKSLLALFKNSTSPQADASLFYSLSNQRIPGYTHRGYVMLPEDGAEPYLVQGEAQIHESSPVYLVFNGPEFETPSVGSDSLLALMELPVFEESIEKANELLLSRGIKLLEAIQNYPSSLSDRYVGATVMISIQLALVDLLTGSARIKLDGCIGYGLGEIASSYAAGMISFQEAIQIAEAGARALATSNGEAAGEVHTKNMAKAGAQLKEEIQNNIGQSGMKWTSKLISTSLSQPNSKARNGDQFDAAEYFSSNISSPALLDQALESLSKDAIVLEVSLQSQLLPVLKKRFVNAFSLMGDPEGAKEEGKVDDYADNEPLKALAITLGALHNAGVYMDLSQLYGVEYPVPCGTSALSPMVGWNHNRNWKVEIRTEAERHGGVTAEVSLQDRGGSFFRHHRLGGKILFAGMGYIKLVWEAFAHLRAVKSSQLPVVFEDVRFENVTVLSEKEITTFRIAISDVDGTFGVFRGDVLACKGRISQMTNPDEAFFPLYENSPESSVPDDDVALTCEEFYKYATATGIQYTGPFQSIKKYKFDGSGGEIQWEDNWVTFLDGMLQMRAAGYARFRLTALKPIRIRRIALDPQKFAAVRPGQNGPVHITCSEALDTVGCSGVEICQATFTVAPVPPQKNVTYSSYKFLPYFSIQEDSPVISITDAFRFCLDVALESSHNSDSFHIVEFLLKSSSDAISEKAYSSLKFTRLIRPKVTTVTLYEDGQESVTPGVVQGDLAILREGDFLVDIIPELTSFKYILIKVDEFIPTRLFNTHATLAEQRTTEGSYALLRRTPEGRPKRVLHSIEVTSSDFSWVKQIREAMGQVKSNPDALVILYAITDQYSGVLGLYNSLRREPGMPNVTCFLYIPDGSNGGICDWDFNSPSKELQEQLECSYAVNIYRDGTWGTYCLFDIEPAQVTEPVVVKHAELVASSEGGSSSMLYIQKPPPAPAEGNTSKEMVHIYYMGIHFKAAMLTSGRILQLNDNNLETSLGCDFSGVTSSGRRVWGFNFGAMSTDIVYDSATMFEVPLWWSLEDAATLDSVWATAYYGLIIRAQLKPGESILIHAGAGGVGIASITLALSMGVTVYTTVGSPEKREFLKKLFPALQDSHISHSRRPKQFECDIMTATNGQGVHVVLNSLSQESLRASLRCLRPNGRFVEIGKYDILNDSFLGMYCMAHGISFYAFDLNNIVTEASAERKLLGQLLKKGMEEGVIKPLPRTVFPFDQVQDALALLSSGKSIGKVVVDMQRSARKEAGENLKIFKAIPRAYFEPGSIYIIIGGLGGMGLEILKWMFDRGARKFLLVSRQGAKQGYQKLTINLLRKGGSQVELYSMENNGVEGCKKLVEFALEKFHNSEVGGIFNMAAVLRDGLFSNQTEERFKQVCESKDEMTRALDEASRLLKLDLKYFVVFSSITSSAGNAGQTNYGYANSVMERIVEQRRRDGLAGIAVQWGPINEVGLLSSDSSKNVGGMQKLNMTSCLKSFDYILTQRDHAIMTLTIPTEVVQTASGEDQSVILQTFARIFGFRSLKGVDWSRKFSEMGMDSLMKAEVTLQLKKFLLEGQIDKQIQDLTLADIQKAEMKLNSTTEAENVAEDDGEVASSKFLNNIELHDSWFIVFDISQNPRETLRRLPSRGSVDKNIFFVHPFDGTSKYMEKLCPELDYKTWVFQCTQDAPLSTIEDLAAFYIEKLKQVQPQGPYIVCGYSFGGVVAVEMALQLEKLEPSQGHRNTLLLLDGTPWKIQAFFRSLAARSLLDEDAISVLLGSELAGIHITKELEQAIMSADGTEQMIQRVKEYVRSDEFTSEQAGIAVKRMQRFFKMTIHYECKGRLNKTDVILLKAAVNPFHTDREISEIFGLENVTDHVLTLPVNGDHKCFGETPIEVGVHELINQLFKQ